MFFLPIERFGLLPISEKKNSLDKKHSEKNKFISGDKKNIFPAILLLCLFFFCRPH